MTRIRQNSVSCPQISDDDYIWALKDINFEVKQGEVLGIIGRNGAGKSTLLKILSRVTAPTSGECRVKGRIASLLEVGTGFHPELTGRENIFLNGAILGMSKEEIRAKFDEIVAFAEVEKYIDTPVKRYSSGMYVRLAFAVAAHLEPEILIVDEVLAVGDMSFQKKCLGKMETVSKEGRTVLFVSHSMPSITSLCGRCLLLDSGLILKDGRTSDVVLNYYTSIISSVSFFDYRNSNKKIGDDFVQLISGWLQNDDGEKCSEIDLNNSLKVCMHYKILKNRNQKPVPNFHFYTSNGTCAFVSGATHVNPLEIGEYIAICQVPSNILNEGTYFIGLAITSHSSRGYHVNFWEKDALCINVRDSMDENVRDQYAGPIPGVVRPSLKWTINEVKQ
jgi:lipopolysaccharide transport system ATP-binding protein